MKAEIKYQTLKIEGRHVVVRLTPMQAIALHSLCGQANADGDHEEWLRGQPGVGPQVRATRECMAIVEGAFYLSRVITEHVNEHCKD